MDRLKVGGVAVAAGVNTAINAVPTWVAVVVLLTVACVPEVCRLIKCIDDVIWRWKRGDRHDSEEDDVDHETGDDG